MIRFRLLFIRLLERRLLGDGEAAASIVAGGLMTLSLSLLLFTLVVQGRTLFDTSLLLAIACFVWSATRAFLESHDLDAAATDRAVLEALPIPGMLLAAARALVIGFVLVISTLNLALPVAILVAVKWGAVPALLLLSGAFLAALSGLALAELARMLLARTLGLQRIVELEGPIRLVVGVALFGLLFAAPDPTALVAGSGLVAALPPFSYAAMVVADGREAAVLCSAAGGIGAAALLLLVFRVAASATRGGGRRRRFAGPSAAGRLVRRLFVRQSELAGFDFALANLARDRTFRARVYPLFAFPFAVILLVVRSPEDPFLALMALYGAAVYLTLAQTFQGFSESPGGPDLLASLPLRDVASFRIGTEKAFFTALAVPVFLVLAVALASVALLGRGLPLVLGLGHAVIAGLFTILLCSLTFDRQTGLAFAAVDRGVYPADLSASTFVALLVAAGFALLAIPLVPSGLAFVGLTAVLIAGIRLSYARKRRRRPG